MPVAALLAMVEWVTVSLVHCQCRHGVDAGAGAVGDGDVIQGRRGVVQERQGRVIAGVVLPP